MSSQLSIGQKCCFLSHFEGKPVWLAGMIKQVVAGNYVIAIRHDYKAVVKGNDCAVMQPDWVFPDWTEASKAMLAADKALSKAIIEYDGNFDWAKEWDSLKAIDVPLSLPTMDVASPS